MNYVIQVLLAVDQLGNAALGGWADESLSAHAFRLNRDRKPWGFTMHLIDTIFFWQPRHCWQAYEAERSRAQEPPEYREPL